MEAKQDLLYLALAVFGTLFVISALMVRGFHALLVTPRIDDSSRLELPSWRVQDSILLSVNSRRVISSQNGANRHKLLSSGMIMENCRNPLLQTLFIHVLSRAIMKTFPVTVPEFADDDVIVSNV